DVLHIQKGSKTTIWHVEPTHPCIGRIGVDVSERRRTCISHKEAAPQHGVFETDYAANYIQSYETVLSTTSCNKQVIRSSKKYFLRGRSKKYMQTARYFLPALHPTPARHSMSIPRQLIV